MDTLMNLNEKGIEAVAINRENHGETNSEDSMITAFGIEEMHINRPFLFSIQDRNSKVILYLGQVMSPVMD